MSWEIQYLPEALDDLRRLDGSQRVQVLKAIKKVSENPWPDTEGGYGKPLGSRNRTNLSGFLKIKLKGAGLRVVYQLVRHEGQMLLIVVGARTDDEVYETAQRRIERHTL